MRAQAHQYLTYAEHVTKIPLAPWMDGSTIAQLGVGMHRTDAGFTAVELLIVVAIAGIVAGVSVPSLTGAMRRYALNGARQTVAAEIRLARFTAVSTSRTMRVRFNCPGPGQFRVVEVVGLRGSTARQIVAQKPAIRFPTNNPACNPMRTDGSSGCRKAPSSWRCTIWRSHRVAVSRH